MGLMSFLVVGALAKPRRPISDPEVRERKNACYADIERSMGYLILIFSCGLWGSQCKASMMAKENCALRYLSPPCYDLIYESDPLEGEKDFVRSQEYKYCVHRISIGESLEGIKGSFDY